MAPSAAPSSSPDASAQPGAAASVSRNHPRDELVVVAENEEKEKEEPLRVAIIGSGMAGLTAAWLLKLDTEQRATEAQATQTAPMASTTTATSTSSARPIHVELFESQHALGLGAHAVDLRVGAHDAVVDIPPRVFVNQFYTQIISLYTHIGIPFFTSNAATTYLTLPASAVAAEEAQAADATTATSSTGWSSTDAARATAGAAAGAAAAAAARNDADDDLHFQFFNLLVGPWSVPMISPRFLLTRSFWRIAIDMFRFKRQTREAFLSGKTHGITLGEFLVANKYSEDFSDRFFIPMFAVICTCTCESVRNYPLHDIVEFMLCLTLQGNGVKRSVCGTRDIVNRLARHLDKVHLGTKVTAVYPTPDGSGRVNVEVDGQTLHFDHVVLGTQANHALQILKEPTEEQRVALSGINYETTCVKLHRDRGLMPASPANWSPMNIFVTPAGGEVMCTAWQNYIQPTLDQNDHVFQTWNPLLEPKPELLVATGHFQRPVVTLKTAHALEVLRSIQGRSNIWYCGAYSLPGIPLLENAARSGLAVAESISSLRRPWTSPLERQIGTHRSIFAQFRRGITWTAAVCVVAVAYSKWSSR